MGSKNNDTRSDCQYLIIGAGPAGLQLGYFFEKTGRDYLILEAGDAPGTYFRSIPGHRTLISSKLSDSTRASGIFLGHRAIGVRQ